MIYIDEYLFFNTIIDYILIKICSSLLKINTKKIRIIISSFFGQLSIISLFISLNNYLLFFVKLLISTIMCLIAFGYNDIKELIKQVIYFNILNIFLGGFLYYLKTQSFFKYKYFIIFVPLIMNIYKYFAYDLKNKSSLKYKVTVYLNNGRILYLNGFMDTGNELIEPYENRKVIIINKNVEENYYFVPYKTINNSSLIKCFNPKKVYIDGIGQRNDISIGVVNKKFKGFNCLLNYKLLEDK